MPLYQEQAVFRTATAVVAQLPDSTTAGGNARGANAVDLQTTRTAATAVASGANSVVAGGNSNVASGQFSTVGGGDNSGAAALAATIAGGQNNFASGAGSWIPGGIFASTHSVRGKGAWAAGAFASNGDAQSGEYVLRRATTDATPTRLTADAAAPGATNTINLVNEQTLSGRLVVTGHQVGAQNSLHVSQTVIIRRGANAAATLVTVGTQETLSVGTTTGWTIAVAADTTLGALSVTATGAAATTIRWVARFITAEAQG